MITLSNVYYVNSEFRLVYIHEYLVYYGDNREALVTSCHIYTIIMFRNYIHIV